MTDTRHWERSSTRYNKIPHFTAAFGCSARNIHCSAFHLISYLKVDLSCLAMTCQDTCCMSSSQCTLQVDEICDQTLDLRQSEKLVSRWRAGAYRVLCM